MAMTLSGDGTIGGLTAGGLPDNSITTNDIAANAVSEGKLASGLYACKAWVNFNGTGTVAIRASGNVTSITDNGTGDYTLNFTTAMPDTNYCVSLGATLRSGGDSNSMCRTYAIANILTTSYRFRNGEITGGFVSQDPEVGYVAIFR